MNKDDLRRVRDVLFYAWDCITLSIKDKWDIYLIIRCESIMSNFLKLLIAKTETIDGRRGSVLPFKLIYLKKAMK